uniref:Submaxillary gland androgen-regulated protein 2, isoform epsilon n=1 Tax=Mus musculus TaxID=10090 RepID=SMR2E_MOUSE|nr:RecName: Full=Submaxillary gland androgen-regulated protein 2, isoform epsilon; AltName: Full=Salivary protein MSG2, isoform epsilon; Flags: Precursor [Mus musculus]AAB93511.1 MSG2epsilon salivary protein [Mus musculus]AAB93517.1 MSG2epsilon salivary protein [Mus musculus]
MKALYMVFVLWVLIGCFLRCKERMGSEEKQAQEDPGDQDL